MFTYHCGELQWSDSATIGFNSPPYDAFTHPLSTALTGAHIRTDEIACIHDGSEWSNVILELEDHNHILEMTPEPTFGTGIYPHVATMLIKVILNNYYALPFFLRPQEAVRKLVSLNVVWDLLVLGNHQTVIVILFVDFLGIVAMTLMIHAHVSLITKYSVVLEM